MNEIRELDRKLDLLMIHFPEFLEQLGNFRLQLIKEFNQFLIFFLQTFIFFQQLL